MNVVFFGDRWDNMWRRRQQLAWQLAKHQSISQLVYVEQPLPLTSLLKVLVNRSDRDARDRWRRVVASRSCLTAGGQNLYVLTTLSPLPARGPAPLYRFSEAARDAWLRRRLGSHSDSENLLVWVSHPQLSSRAVQALKPAFLWYDCTEDFAAIPGLPDCVRKDLVSTDSWLTSHAQVVTTVSRTLYREKLQVNPNTYLLPNAVDTDSFECSGGALPVPDELRSAPRPVLTFVGGLNDWAHDWELLAGAARLRPGWTFVLIGDLEVGTKTRLILEAHPNLRCVGRRPYSDIARYLVNSDICFQFYRRGRENDTRNSQKLFLYLAAGKPVISTESADVESYREHVCIAARPQEFVALAERSLAGDSDAAARARREVAHQNSWTRRAEQVFTILEHCHA